mgnify:CR=1 FL=1
MSLNYAVNRYLSIKMRPLGIRFGSDRMVEAERAVHEHLRKVAGVPADVVFLSDATAEQRQCMAEELERMMKRELAKTEDRTP